MTSRGINGAPVRSRHPFGLKQDENAKVHNRLQNKVFGHQSEDNPAATRGAKLATAVTSNGIKGGAKRSALGDISNSGLPSNTNVNQSQGISNVGVPSVSVSTSVPSVGGQQNRKISHQSLNQSSQRASIATRNLGQPSLKHRTTSVLVAKEFSGITSFHQSHTDSKDKELPTDEIELDYGERNGIVQEEDISQETEEEIEEHYEDEEDYEDAPDVADGTLDDEKVDNVMEVDQEDTLCGETDLDMDEDDAQVAEANDITMTATPEVCVPVFTVEDEEELQMVRTKFTEEVDPWDISMVPEYADEIFPYMRELEERYTPNPQYMHSQRELGWHMRRILIDWLVQVHARFHLLPETLFLTINLVDRFLTLRNVAMTKLQLVGATALFVAAKYEEITCPSVDEVVFMVDNSYNSEEILGAERFMINVLEFNLGWPGPMSFLRRISKADDYDVNTRTLAKYLLEVTLIDERFVASPPSYVAAVTHCLARRMLNMGDWSEAHVFYSCYTWRQIHPSVVVLLDCLTRQRQHHPSIFAKYAEKRYKRASRFVEAWMAKGIYGEIVELK